MAISYLCLCLGIEFHYIGSYAIGSSKSDPPIPMHSRMHTHIFLFDNIVTFLKKSPLDSLLGHKTHEQLIPPAKTNSCMHTHMYLLMCVITRTIFTLFVLVDYFFHNFWCLVCLKTIVNGLIKKKKNHSQWKLVAWSIQWVLSGNHFLGPAIKSKLP